MIAEYTTRDSLNVTTKDNSGYIADAKLAIHGSYGNQLLDYTKMSNSVTLHGVTIKNTKGVFTEVGKVNVGTQVDLQPNGTFMLDTGVYTLSGGVTNFYPLLHNKTTGQYLNGDTPRQMTLSQKCEIEIFIRVVGGFDELTAIKPMLCKGVTALPFEPYTGGTPYTDKYKPTITAQSGNSVTLSIENVSALEGDTTKLDIELTDITGVTKRSEDGKTFIGGGE